MAENDNSIKANLEEINTKKDTTSTISFRLPTWLKAKVLEVADSKGQSPSGFSSFVVYKATMEGLVSQEDYDQLKEDLQEAERKNDTWEKAYKELEEKKQELDKRPNQKQLDELKKEKDKLSKQVTDLQKQLKQAETDKSKTDNAKDKQIKELEKQLEQMRQVAKQKGNERQSEAKKCEQLEKKATEMQYYINRHAAGLFQKPKQFVDGVPTDPDEEQ
jgi:DNA repair exonuclease SbcCD ATPase subunit